MRGYSECVNHGPTHLEWPTNQPQRLEKCILQPRKMSVTRTINDLQDWQKPYIQIFTILFCSHWSGLHSSMAFLPRSVKYCTPILCILEFLYSYQRHHISDRDLHASRILRSVQVQFLTDVSGQPIGPIFKGQEIRHQSLRNIPHERRTHLNRGGWLKSGIIHTLTRMYRPLLRMTHTACVQSHNTRNDGRRKHLKHEFLSLRDLLSTGSNLLRVSFKINLQL